MPDAGGPAPAEREGRASDATPASIRRGRLGTRGLRRRRVVEAADQLRRARRGRARRRRAPPHVGASQHPRRTGATLTSSSSPGPSPMPRCWEWGSKPEAFAPGAGHTFGAIAKMSCHRVGQRASQSPRGQLKRPSTPTTRPPPARRDHLLLFAKWKQDDRDELTTIVAD